MQNCPQGIARAYKELRNLRQKYVSTGGSSQKTAWQNLELFLCYRANFSFAARLFYTLVFMIIGISHLDKSENFIADGEASSKEFVDANFPTLKIVYILLTFGRIPLMLISARKLTICKTYIYYEVVCNLVEECMPRDCGEYGQELLM